VLSPSEFRELVSGRRRGPVATLLRCGLRVVEVPYTAAVRWRNRRFDNGAKTIHRVGVPVVSVGNLTLGGTGKSPMVHWIAKWLRKKGLSVTIISRGYGSDSSGENDEALELKQKLPDVPHLQNPDRVAAAEEAIKKHGCEVILLDDAFQHRRIARDLDIALIDALEPFGFDHVFPRGTLREPVEGLARADVVVLSRADMLDEALREEIRRRAQGYAPQAAWVEVRHAADSLVSGKGTVEPLESLKGRPVAAFCGIGNPAGFRHTLSECGFEVVTMREFPDHHRYTSADVASLESWAAGLDIEAVVCTQKDIVKLDVENLGNCPLRAVSIGMDILAGEERLEAALAKETDRRVRRDAP